MLFSEISPLVYFFLFFHPSGDINLQKPSSSMDFTTPQSMLFYILSLPKCVQKVLLTSYLAVKTYYAASRYVRTLSRKPAHIFLTF